MHLHFIKRLTAFCGIFALCGGLLTGCGTAQDDRLTIVTTVYAAYDLAKQLTAEFDTPCEVRLLLTPGGESHAYDPSPSDVAAVQSCDLFVYIGGTSEVWAEKLIASTRSGKQNLRMFDCVELLREETVEGMEADTDDAGDEYDEHIWTAPLNADAMLTALRTEISAIAPEETAHCDAAYDSVHAELLELDARAQQIRDTAQNDTLIFADRFPFRYLTDAYGWNYYAAFAGCSSDTDASAATLSFLISKVKELEIDTVFYLENASTKISEAVCKATGAHAVMLQSCSNVSAADFEAGVHYQTLMQQNLSAIEEALN